MTPPGASAALGMAPAQVLVHSADISSPARPWSLSSEWGRRVQDEFFLQGEHWVRVGLAPVWLSGLGGFSWASQGLRPSSSLRWLPAG